MNERVIVLPIEGMTCGNCVRRIEQALHEVEGVTNARADLATKTATVHIVDGDANAEDLMQAIRIIGYHLSMDKVVLSISGMTCFNCVREVDTALSNVVGVTNVSISLMTEKAVVSYVPGIATMQDLKDAVAKTGKRVIDPDELNRNKPTRRYMVNTGTPRGGCCT
ncbi:MAG: copper ion binding protein [Anaerolineales bacterium]|nr:copper ion binding protein [Anaerolineales bacterium]